MKKYIISIVSTALCLMSAYADDIAVANVSMSPGEPKSVSINLTNTETNLVSFQMDLTLPDGITVNKSGCSLSSRFPDDQELTIGRQPNGAIRLTSTSFALTPISGTSGEIITLSLTASDDSEGGTATISNIRFVTSNSERITLNNTTFNISVGSTSPNITFADPAVKAICVDPATNWDTNHDGELSEAEAANVTDLGEVFKRNTEITSFDELQYFTGLTSIGNGAFSECRSLTSITIPNSVTSIGQYAFYDCTGLTSVTIPNSVTSIGHQAFDGCSGLTSISIPGSVTSIGHSAFAYCSGLTSITIPSNLTSIDGNAFFGCSGLTSIKVASGNTFYDSRGNCNAIIETAMNTLIAGCQNTIIPNSVTSIGYSAFSHCSSLASITIPSSVTNIGNYAFAGCSGLTSVTIPNSVTSIGEGAFEGCSGLTSITIPNSVTSISNRAFILCSGLTSITIPNSVTSIGGEAFAACSGLTSITIPNSVTTIDSNAFMSCGSLKDFWCYAEDIPSTGNDLFLYTDIASATLHVPAASLETYSTTAPWSGFGTIVPIEEPGIEVTDISQMDNAIYIEPFVARIDANNKMEICLKNAGNVSGYVFELVLPEGVTVATDNDGNCIDELTNRHNGQQSFFNNLGENRYRFGCLGTNSLTGSDGAIHVLTIHVDENMLEGVYAIEIRDVSLSNTNGQMVEVPSTTTSVSIEECQLGDVNANGKIDIGDAVTIANHLVGKPTYNFVERASDTNGNGIPADIGDAVTIALYLVGKPCNLSNSVKEWNENEIEPQ